MKTRLIICITFLFAAFMGLSQPTVRFQGTILPGSASNSIIFAIKPSENFTGVFLNFQMVLQIPETFSPIPRVAIKKNFLNAVNAGADYVPDNVYNENLYQIVTSSNTAGYFTHEGGYYNYLFAFVTSGAPAYTGIQNTEINVLEVEILDVTVPRSQVRFAQLPDNGFVFGGLSGQHNFYIEANIQNNPPPGTTAADYTNQTAPFYASNPANFHNDGGGYSFYSWASIPAALLPVKFSGFKASCESAGTLVSWTTEFEQNSNYFEVQKSVNGRDWSIIGRVEAANNSALQKNYQYYDVNSSGTSYYRVREVDIDGQYNFTPVERTNCITNQVGVDIYPVPAKNDLTVSVETGRELKTDLQILDVTGRVLRNISTQLNKGKTIIRLDISDLPNGQYILISKDPSKIINKQFTVIK